MSDEDGSVRCGAAWVLGDIGPGAREALPTLRQLLDDEEPAARFCAAGALWKIDRQGKVAVPTLLAAWKEDITALVPLRLRLEAVGCCTGELHA